RWPRRTRKPGKPLRLEPEHVSFWHSGETGTLVDGLTRSRRANLRSILLPDLNAYLSRDAACCALAGSVRGREGHSMPCPCEAEYNRSFPRLLYDPGPPHSCSAAISVSLCRYCSPTTSGEKSGHAFLPRRGACSAKLRISSAA